MHTIITMWLRKISYYLQKGFWQITSSNYKRNFLLFYEIFSLVTTVPICKVLYISVVTDPVYKKFYMIVIVKNNKEAIISKV